MSKPQTIIPNDPTFGLVIGTSGSVPYVHLQLEARRRLYPEVPLLVNDDCSPAQTGLNDLCADYGADYSFSTTHLGHIFGDTSAFWNGLLWAKRKQVDLLVKFSRRFVPLNDWRPSLREVAIRTQAATFSSICQTWNFGFRTESMAMHVSTWLSQHQIADFRDRTARGDMLNGLPESFFHTWSGNVHPPCLKCDTGSLSFGLWDWTGFGRGIANPNFFWHQTTTLDEYAHLARAWGLPYRAADFHLETMPLSPPVSLPRDTAPTISIIIPTIGRPSLARQIHSLLPQLAEADNVIVVGDGSQPAARSLIQTINDPRVSYFEHSHPLSVYGNAQRNFGVDHANGDLLWFVDDDDVALPHALAAIRSEVKSVPTFFRMFTPKAHVWQRPAIEHGQVGGAMLVLPRAAFKPWPVPTSIDGSISDLEWIRSMPGDVRFNASTIYHVPARGFQK